MQCVTILLRAGATTVFGDARFTQAVVQELRGLAGLGGEPLRQDHSVWLARCPSLHLHKSVWVTVCKSARYGQGQEAHGSLHFRPRAAAAGLGFPSWASTVVDSGSPRIDISLSLNCGSCGRSYKLGHASRLCRSRFGTSHMVG